MTFSVQLSSFASSSTLNLSWVVKETVRLLGEELVERSPVGDPAEWLSPAPKSYEPGHFKANWQHQLGSMSSNIRPGFDPSGDISTRQITSSVNAVRNPAGVHYLYNNVPYAKALENGWSDQAPSGMVGLTVMGFQNTVSRAMSGGLRK